MKINYSICIKVPAIKKGRKHTYEYTNGSIEGDFNWDSDEDHAKIRQIIRDKHPGYSIQGYCIAPDNQQKIED